ncbi:FAD-dependent oxidoreductase [Ramlibacter tataouinensis]|uniref:FAD-dependent oxidoreductase n=1 Tax=Ramlibacter tataouinensis TaxID=94132 RepID=UPI0022F3FC0C|nr:FAD-dependent oxidoreductase [Ramlibacter tataouinensis]WBY02955.1 FAD-dependent oxidoreductase [Ramlibacter tataouinensis]
MTSRDHAEVEAFDLLVVGAGCAGLSTALFASQLGLSVLVVEKSPWVGGTSALSAGALWVPGTGHAAGTGDTREQAARYLQAAVGDGSSSALRDAFLDLAPRAVEELERDTAVRLRAFAHHPDYLSNLPGSTVRGRVLECLPFDGRLLGADLARVRPPIPEFTVLGGMMVDRIDIGHLLNLTRSWASLRYSVRLLGRHAIDRLRHRRGTRLVLGNALVGRLLLSLRRRGVPVWTDTPALRLVTADGRVTGLAVRRQGQDLSLSSRCGVVMAGGGFNDHPHWRSRWLPPMVTDTPRAGTSGGELLDDALRLGARLTDRSAPDGSPGSSACWAPVSVRRRPDGSKAVFPHFVLDRAKPGTLVVDGRGERFVDESTSYHLFGEALLAHAARHGLPGHAWLIADAAALRHYGLGMVRPGGAGLRRFLREGYIVRADSCTAMAAAIGVPAATLERTVARFNALAASGTDADFGRGRNAYQRNLGDPAHAPNPTLRPLAAGPWFAVRLQVADIACSRGLVTDASARVLHHAGSSLIPGLYAVGNDMQSVMGSAYPGPGINLGPAVVFAYAAALAAAQSAAHPQSPALSETR